MKGQSERETGRPIVNCRDSLQRAVQKQLNRLRYRLEYGLGWAQGSMLDGGAHWHHLANTIEMSMCGGDEAFLSDYFDPLLTLRTRGVYLPVLNVSLCGHDRV